MLTLSPTTAEGHALLRLANELAPVLGAHAARHDREASFPRASLDALVDRGYLYAPIPAHLGGLGVGSVHDVVVAATRLAGADPSVVIGANMHLLAVLNLRRRWSVACAAGDERRAAALGASLAELPRRRTVLSAAISELGQDLTRPSTTATATAGGWTITGRKAFCTMSPGATVLYTAVRFAGPDGVERYGYAMVPADAPGVTIHDDWDALGMRASGTNSITYEDVRVPAAALRGGFPVGDGGGYMARNLPAGLLHAAAALGVAEGADEHVRELLRRRATAGDDGRTLMLAAQNAMDLAAARATLSRAAATIDEGHAFRPDRELDAEEVEALFTEAQIAKVVVGEAAGRVVERALELSGGAGYRSSSPLARAYRDVRATMFMHPLGANRAYDHIGRAALSLGVSIN